MKNTRLLIALFLLLLLFRSVASARQGRGFTLEQVLSSPFPSELAAARKGERIAWVFDSEGRRNIWVAEGPQFQARQLTHYDRDDGQELTDLGFSFDGNWVVFVRGGDKNRAGEYPNPTSEAAGVKQQVLAAGWTTGQVRVVGEGNSPVPSPAGLQVVFSKGEQLWVASLAEARGEARQLFNARGSNDAPHWSPDGKRVAFVSGRGDHSFIGVYDIAAKMLSFLAPTVDRDSNPCWSPDGKQIAFVRRPALGNRPAVFLDDAPDPWAVMVADLEGARAREVWRSGRGQNDSMPPAGEDLLQWAAGGRLIFASEQDGWMHLYSISSEGGAAELLTPGACEVEHLTITPDRRSIVFSSNCGDIDRRHLWRVAVAGGKPSAITSGEKIEWSPVVTGDAEHVVYLGSDARTPAMPYALPSAGGAAHMLAAQALPRDFPSAQLAVPQQVVFKASDGEEIHGQLFLPPGASAGTRLPAVVFMHGGPMRQMLLGWHYMYYYHNAYGMNQYLASRGYAVLSVNYRSGIGYGRAFRMAPKRGARGASEYQDILAATKFLRSRDDIDPKHVGLWGGSYGGYLTALGLARDSDIFAAGVDLHGVHDWSQRISGASWIDYSSRDAQKVALESSPVGSVSKWRSPVLLIQGDDDRNVSFSQMVDLARRLREQNVEFEQMVFPDEVHDFLLHRHWLAAYHAASDFFDRKLKGQG
ncbi:MAG TPA: prolyl oligopeptidase family serine peptidase [Pyrinomonadaceae bacterium]|jgi:dipeptidyl aminopeptidase/acylaminoacyl peptidase|nr:prolyl oligopeptidase family serine peptidase [Pyrinomonadaceae bacterium]